MGRYVKFFKNLVSSKNDDVRLLEELVGKDATSITGRNISKLWQETGVNPWIASPSEIRSKIERTAVPEIDEWRLPYLQKLLLRRYEMESNLEDTKNINNLIDELCVS